MREQLRQLSGDTAVYGVTTVIQRFLSFLLTPFYTHYLVPSELGVQSSVFATIAFIMVLANVGMEASFFKFYSIAEHDTEKRAAYWNAVVVSWCVALLIGASMAVVPQLWNLAIRIPAEYEYLIRMSGAIVTLDALSTIGLALLRMQRKAKRFGAIKISAIALNIVLNITFLSVMNMKLTGIFTANIIQSGLQFALTLPLIIGMLPILIDATGIRNMMRFGLPTVASSIAAVALQVIDRPIMQQIAGLATVGLYQANYRLGTIMMMFVAMFEFAWRPFFLQHAAKENAKELFARVFTYFNLGAALVFLVIGLYIVNIATMPIPFRHGASIVSQTYWSGLVIVPIVLCAYIFNGWYTNFVAGIYIEKQTKVLPWITGLGALTNAILCFALIPIANFSIAGGALATWVAYLVMALALLMYVRKIYPIPYEWKRVGKIFLGLGIVWWINVATLNFYNRSLEAALARFGLLVLFVAWLFVSRFFERGELSEISKRIGSVRSGLRIPRRQGLS